MFLHGLQSDQFVQVVLSIEQYYIIISVVVHFTFSAVVLSKCIKKM